MKYGYTYIRTPKPFLLLLDKQRHTANTQHSTLEYTSVLPLLVHTSFSSFTLHLPPSRRDWTSCSLPSAAATSRSLTTEALDAVCVMTEVAFNYSVR